MRLLLLSLLGLWGVLFFMLFVLRYHNGPVGMHIVFIQIENTT